MNKKNLPLTPSDFAGDLAEYMEGHSTTVYHAFNEENKTLIIDL